MRRKRCPVCKDLTEKLISYKKQKMCKDCVDWMLIHGKQYE